MQIADEWHCFRFSKNSLGTRTTCSRGVPNLQTDDQAVQAVQAVLAVQAVYAVQALRTAQESHVKCRLVVLGSGLEKLFRCSHDMSFVRAMIAD